VVNPVASVSSGHVTDVDSTHQFNLAMWRALTPEQLDRRFTHPEYGELTVGWIMAQMAGHDIHHLKQFRQGRLDVPASLK
jgi:hypothetical protein